MSQSTSSFFLSRLTQKLKVFINSMFTLFLISWFFSYSVSSLHAWQVKRSGTVQLDLDINGNFSVNKGSLRVKDGVIINDKIYLNQDGSVDIKISNKSKLSISNTGTVKIDKLIVEDLSVNKISSTGTNSSISVLSKINSSSSISTKEISVNGNIKSTGSVFAGKGLSVGGSVTAKSYYHK